MKFKNAIIIVRTETLLKKIHCPVFILHGSMDPMVKRDQPEYLNKHLIDSQIHYFPKASHNCHQVCAKEFNNLVTMFLMEWLISSVWSIFSLADGRLCRLIEFRL